MGYGEPATIAAALRKIREGRLILPAIQREFVWENYQIERLFDSVLRGYPIGSFLSWTVQPETTHNFRIYGFLKDYHEKHNPYCSALDLPEHKQLTENVGKTDTMPLPWATATFPGDSYSAYLARNELPGLPDGPGELLDWFDRRALLLAKRLRVLLKAGSSEPISEPPKERAAARQDDNAHSLGE